MMYDEIYDEVRGKYVKEFLWQPETFPIEKLSHECWGTDDCYTPETV